MLRPCLDCGRLTERPMRCGSCARKQANAASAIGRLWRGPRWTQLSKRLRRYWSDSGFGCIDAADGKCKGQIQADHLGARGPYVPRCAYHNNAKGRQWH